jgi:site-specific DNA recombinase
MSPDKKHLSLPLDVYVRVSKVGGREGDSFISPELQEERAKAMLAAKGFQAGQIFIDLDQSGGKMRRPAFNEAMARIRDGKSGGIVVHKLDRFARNVRGLLEAVEEIESHGAVFICVEPGLDTSDKAYGRFLLQLFGALAELELAKITKAWSDAHVKHVDRGVSTGRAPFGYRKGEGGVLEPDPVTGPVVCELFERRARGETYRSLAEWLQEQGIEKPYSDKPWIDRDVMKFLKNEAYLGIVRFGGVPVRRADGEPRVDPATGQVVLTPVFENRDAHPPLVDEEIWWRVRAGEKSNGTHQPKGEHLLTGYVLCSGCGYRMARSSSKTGDKVFFYWRCRYPHCANKAGVSALHLEPYVLRRVAEAAVVMLERPAEHSDRLDRARATVAHAEERLATFDATWVDRGIDPVDVLSVRKPLVEQLDAARRQLAEVPIEESDDVLGQVRRAYQLPEVRAWIEGDALASGEEAVARLDHAFAHGLTGESLEVVLATEPRTSSPEINERLSASRKRMLKQVLRAVEVTGKKGPVDERVEIVLRPEVAPAAS